MHRFKTYFRATPRSEILFANYFLMTDWSSGTLQTLYVHVSPGFTGYLGTLGMRDALGAPRLAWEAWRRVR